MAQLASRFRVHPTMINSWCHYFVESAAEIFRTVYKSRKRSEA